MKPRLLSACLTTTLLFLAACTPAPEPAPEPEDTTEANLAALAATGDQFLAAWNASDTAAFGSLFAEDAVQMPPDGPNIEGRQAIQEGFQAFHDEFAAQQTATTDETSVTGDLAFVRGTYQYVQTPTAGGEEVEVRGKWFLVSQRQADGSWRIARHMWNRPVENDDSD